MLGLKICSCSTRSPRRYTDDQFFGALQYVNDPGSEKYDALVSETELPGDANFDGNVNFADFQILEQNYGLSNTWWQKGDFNGQGVTNWSDLNLLRTNLDPTSMTLAQFAQVALFGQPSVPHRRPGFRVRRLWSD